MIKKCLFFLTSFLSTLSYCSVQQEQNCHEKLIDISVARKKLESEFSITVFEKKIDSIKQSLKQQQKPVEKCNSYIAITNLLLKIGNNDEALKYINAIELSIKKINKQDPALASLLLKLGNILHRVENFEKSLLFAYESLEVFEKSKVKNPIVKANIYALISAVFISTGQIDKAVENVNLAEKFNSNRDPSVHAVILNLKAHLTTLRPGLYSKNVLELLDENKKHCLEHNLHKIAFTAIINKSAILYSRGKICEAIDEINEAFTLKDLENVNNLIIAYTSIATLLRHDNQLKLSEDYLKLALEVSEKFHVQDKILQLHVSLYQLNKIKRNNNIALFHLEKADSLKEEIAEYNLKKNINEIDVRYKTAQKDKEIIAKNLELEKSQNKQILYSAVIIISFVILGYSIFSLKRRQRNKIQSLKKEQEISNLKAMIEGEEKERTRLAGELHDGIGSMLAVAQLNIDNILDDSQNLTELQEVRKHLNKTAKEVRNVAHNLVPHILQHNSLQEALYLYSDHLMSGGKLKIDIQIDNDIPVFNENIKLILYRIIQELLQNAIKHASATQIFIQIRARQGKLLIFVEDNGEGFNPETVNYGLGIHNIDLRVKALNGSFEIQSDKEFGSIFSISFDIDTLDDFKIYNS